MLDIKLLRTEPEKIKEALKNRANDLDITPAIELDAKRREILAKVEQMKAKQNEITKSIPAMKKAGEPLNAGKIAELTGLDRKIVDKAMAAMKKDGSIVSPIRCKWEPAEK